MINQKSVVFSEFFLGEQVQKTKHIWKNPYEKLPQNELKLFSKNHALYFDLVCILLQYLQFFSSPFQNDHHHFQINDITSIVSHLYYLIAKLIFSRYNIKLIGIKKYLLKDKKNDLKIVFEINSVNRLIRIMYFKPINKWVVLVFPV